ncbi:istB-like ATP binding family protein, partial [Chlamydia psittaci 84-8471/1]
EIPC